MKIKRILLVPLLIACSLAPGCAKKAVTDPSTGQIVEPAKPGVTGDDILAAAKTLGLVLSDALEQAIPLEAALAADGTIDAAVEPGIRKELANAKKAVDEFNARAAKYDHFDATSQADINKLRDDAIAFVERMNTNGVLHIKNARSQLIASGLLAGVKFAVRIYDDQQARLNRLAKPAVKSFDM